MPFNYSTSTGVKVWKCEKCESVKNTMVHDGTLNVITAIKLSDTDNVVVVETDVNLLILLSKRTYHSNA